MTVDRNILPGMKPTRHSFRCGQPLGPGVAHHGMRNLVHHAQAHVASPRGERLPAQVAEPGLRLRPQLRLSLTRLFSVSSERHWQSQRRVNGIAKVPKRKVFTEVGFEPGRECPVAIPSQRSI